MSEEYAAIFKEEAGELLEELETALLELDERPEDMKVLGRIFRAMHTIKGSGAMFGFDDIADFTHHVETILDRMRDGKIYASKKLINLIFASKDYIAKMLDSASGGKTVDRDVGEKIIFSLQALIDAGESGADTIPVASESATNRVAEAGAVIHYRISFRPSTEFFLASMDFDALHCDLNEIGECSILGKSDGSIDEYISGEKEAFWEILLHTSKGINEIRDIFIFVENIADVQIVEIGEENDFETAEVKKLGTILVERGYVGSEDLVAALNTQKPIGKVLVEKMLVSPEKVDLALAEQQVMTKKRQNKIESVSRIKVAAEKLDYLINLVGEMVVTQARLSQASVGHDNVELSESVEEVERLTSELRDCVLNIRMLPIGTTFSKFKRLVRDLSAELGKEIDMVTEGAETELDKSVIEQMGDPLVHLIRNSIDHGIELPEERQAVGKSRRGIIRLKAEYSGANVVITVEDDGKGLNGDSIRKKAIEKGFITSGADLSEEDIFELVFGAGVSTAEKVTGVSGRGVGMDVVKTIIEGKLKGAVNVTSRKGKGTIITIILPLTLAIIDGLLVKVGGTHFVLPLSQVEECVELTNEDVERFHGRHLYPVREQLVPYVNLREFFSIAGDELDLRQMVIVNLNGDRFGMVLDDVIGGHQTVIKSLGWVYRNTEGVSGATILGSGEVALIVDVANLIKHAQIEELPREAIF